MTKQSENVKPATDRPALEIEITEEMIEAGLDWLGQNEEVSSAYLVEGILLAGLGTLGFRDTENGYARAQNTDLQRAEAWLRQQGIQQR
ncbi:hypothetical protein [Stakelama tenebrarum]|uniref:Uncharacterized protein n=1 Tax=Stakelama tenebrarum TaxID=2711215 RepID=A0A6G6Y0B1_9SPHN|nr:hypothetical protein [Sphingosinithalassobacter tenebrarum]QIG78384.1 hypothetical protein G5C33_00295 [Sphingosinithalassobacter tenebrarum]